MPSDVDTSVISDEYELLYQSVKITEYKSRLSLYVTAYSFCLGVVIILMIMSPFLTEPVSFLSNRKVITPESQTALYNKVENKITNEVTESEVPKNNLGLTDSVNKVIYIQLPDGKFAIQESSWNNEEKGKERVKMLNALKLKGVNGKKVKAQLVKADLGDKGVWYRAMFGEFTTIEEAKQKAGEIKSAGKPVTGKPKNLSEVSKPNGLI